ncbi:MAG: aspartyl/glutamyl-tRNA amidotransferase subunit A [Omnitrophica WOR_2 bacterium RBG_13_41_10]|nr:MAG: aspartyl/glutamyl-tRNA amidotransferase subunit A [Omnitrophica WOR_2 bacterium RBG_13_41_10]
MKLNALTAGELLERLDKKDLSPSEIISSLNRQIQETDSKVKAYVRLSDSLEHQTPSIKHQAPTLEGIPISIKDNICTEGYNTECCSRILAGFKPPYDATVIKKLKEAGASISEKKTNMDEFAFGSSTENSCFYPTHNPWNLECVPGGSSGGSAASVASDEAIWALGSDTGGSIRQPASFCGVVGLKPTYGRVSRYGLIAFASSLDQIGPLTKDTRDAALLTNIISGYDPCDSTSADIKVPDFTQALVNDVKGIKIGIPKEYFIEGLDSEIKVALEEAINKLKELGAVFKEVSLPNTKYAVPVYYIIATAEASSNLARFDAVQYGCRSTIANGLIDMYKKSRGEGFGPEAKRRILLGTFALSHGYYDAYYLRSLKVRTLIKEDFDQVLKDLDCIITPTSPTAAFKIGEKVEDPLKMYLSDIYTISANLAGIPAISLPCGFTRDNLPVGLQILAKPFDEEMIFRVAYTYEQNTPWHKMKPKL